MAKSKFYAIRKGRKNNIVLDSWSECEELTKGYPSEYKAFTMEKDAYDWINTDTLENVAQRIKDLLDDSNMYITYQPNKGIILQLQQTDKWVVL